MTKNFDFKTQIEELDVHVSFTYYPEEPTVRYYRDGTGHPGFPASVQDVCVTTIIEGVHVDITDVLDKLGFNTEDMAWNELEGLDDEL